MCENLLKDFTNQIPDKLGNIVSSSSRVKWVKEIFMSDWLKVGGLIVSQEGGNWFI